MFTKFKPVSLWNIYRSFNLVGCLANVDREASVDQDHVVCRSLNVDWRLQPFDGRPRSFRTFHCKRPVLNELAQKHRKNVSIKNFHASKTNEWSGTFSYKFLYKKFNFSFQNFSIFNLKIVLSFFRSFARLFVRSLDCSFVHVNVGTYPSIIF